MKKKFGKLSKEKQEKRESEYHRMKPEEFDRLMTRARRYTPHTIRLPAAWIDGLEAMAELDRGTTPWSKDGLKNVYTRNPGWH